MIQAIQIKPDITDDYVLESLMSLQKIQYQHLLEMGNIALEQANFVLEALTENNTESVIEATQNTRKGVVNSVKGAIDKIIQIIKNIFGRFKDFLQTAFQNNEKWLAERENDFKTMNYDGMAISMVPYWLGDVSTISKNLSNKISNEVKAAVRSAKSRNQSKAEFFVSEEGYKNLFRNVADGDNIVDGLKNTLRVNNKNGMDEATLEGGQLKSKILSEFIPFVKNYKKYINDVDKEIRNIETDMRAIENELKSRGVTESLIEGIPLEHTDLCLLESFQAVLEAEGDTKNNREDDQKNKQSGRVKDSSLGSTKVTLLKGEEKREKETAEKVKSYTDLELKITRQYGKAIQLLLASVMTVYEEKYSAYMNALKVVYKSGNTRYGRKGNQPENNKKKK